MAVYVDELKRWGKVRRQTCHLTADSVEELREFADLMGFPRGARHYGASVPHYDLNAEQRQLALEGGAEFVPAKEQARARIAARKRS